MKLAMLVVAFICSFIAAANAGVEIFKGEIEGKPTLSCFLKVEKNADVINFEPYASRFRLQNYNITQRELTQTLMRDDMQVYLNNDVQGLNLSFGTDIKPYEYSVLNAQDEVLFICQKLVNIQ